VTPDTITPTIPELAGAIAAELGYSLVSTPHEHGAVLAGPDHARLWIGPSRRYTDRKRRRLYIEAEFPRTERGETLKPYNAGELSITVARDKAPAVIAADIRRRLIPRALEAWAHAERNRAAYTEAADNARTLALELETILGEPSRSSARDSFIWYTGQGGQLTLSHSGGSLSAELRSCSPDFARELAALLAKYGRGE
jgi:hypothetical protein